MTAWKLKLKLIFLKNHYGYYILNNGFKFLLENYASAAALSL